MRMINFLKHFLQTQDGMLVYLLAIICCLMILDFVTGTVAAYINPKLKWESHKGINGLLRKLVSFALMIVLIPMAILIPMGIELLYTLYTGYMLLEFKSIIENLDKSGGNVGPFKIFLNGIESKLSDKKLEDDKDKVDDV